MKTYFILFVVLTAAVSHLGNGSNDWVNSKIKDGEVVDENDSERWKPMVAIFLHSFGNRPSQICGGTLISDKAVLTAAHCLQCFRMKYPVENITVVHGHFDLSVEGLIHHRIVKTFVHPDYIVQPSVNDIGIAVLPYRLNTTDFVNLPFPEYNLTRNVLLGMEAQVGGWGLSSSGDRTKLRKATVTVVPNDECQTLLNPTTHLCAKPKSGDACYGDSGGPLLTVYQDTVLQIGIISGGKSCERATTMGYYTRLDKYFEFIINGTLS